MASEIIYQIKHLSMWVPVFMNKIIQYILHITEVVFEKLLILKAGVICACDCSELEKILGWQGQ